MYCERLCVGGSLTDGEDGVDRRSCSCERTTREREREDCMPFPPQATALQRQQQQSSLSRPSSHVDRSLARLQQETRSHTTPAAGERERERRSALVCVRGDETRTARASRAPAAAAAVTAALLPSSPPSHLALCLSLLLLSSRPATAKRGRRAVAFSVSLSRSHLTREQETRGIEKGVLSLVTQADVDQSRVSPSTEVSQRRRRGLREEDADGVAASLRRLARQVIEEEAVLRQVTGDRV